MNPKTFAYFLSAAIIALCAWSARELLEYWSFSPYDRVAPWAFLLWLTPLLQLKGRGISPSWGLLIMAAVIGGYGMFLMDTSVACVALALSIVGIMPCRWGNLLWLAVSVSWMPIMGDWGAFQGLMPRTVHILRIVIVLLGLALFFKTTRSCKGCGCSR